MNTVLTAVMLLVLAVWLVGPLLPGRRAGLEARRVRIAFLVRGIGFAAAAVLVLASAPTSEGPIDQAESIAIIDVSGSVLPVGATAEAWYPRWIHAQAPRATRWLAVGERVALVPVGTGLAEARRRVGVDGTDLAGALDLVAAYGEAHRAPLAVDVMTDLPRPEGTTKASAPEASALRAALERLAARATVTWHRVPAPPELEAAAVHEDPRALLTRLELPYEVTVHQPVPVRITLSPTRTVPLELEVRSGAFQHRVTVAPTAPPQIALTVPGPAASGSEASGSAASGSATSGSAASGSETSGYLTVAIRLSAGADQASWTRLVPVRPPLRVALRMASDDPLGAFLERALPAAAAKEGARLEVARTGAVLPRETDLVVADEAGVKAGGLDWRGLLRTGAGIWLAGGEGLFGAPPPELEPVLPVAAPAHGAAGDEPTVVIVVDSSESLARGGAPVENTVGRILDGLAAQLGPGAPVAVLSYSDEQVALSPQASCAEVETRADQLVWPANFDAHHTLADLSRVKARVTAALEKARQPARPSTVTSLAREGLQLAPALRIAAAAAQCRHPGPVQLVVIADDRDLLAIGPEDWRPDIPPAAVLATVLEQLSASDVTLSLVGLRTREPERAARPLSISWETAAGLLARVGGSALRIEDKTIPLIGLQRQYRPLSVQGRTPLEVQRRLARGGDGGSPEASSTRGYSRLRLRPGAMSLVEARPAGEAPAPVLASWRAREGSRLLAGRVAALTVPSIWLDAWKSGNAPLTQTWLELSAWLLRERGPVPAMTLTRGAEAILGRIAFPAGLEPAGVRVGSEAGAAALEPGGAGQYAFTVPLTTHEIQLEARWPQAAQAGASSRWRLEVDAAWLEPASSERFAPDASRRGSEGAGAGEPAGSSRQNPLPPWAWLGLWAGAVVLDVFVRRR